MCIRNNLVLTRMCPHAKQPFHIGIAMAAKPHTTPSLNAHERGVFVVLLGCMCQRDMTWW